MSDVRFKVVIPARFDSSRLPGKVLLDIEGMPMLEHVYQRAVESGAEQIIIATDNEKVREVAEQFGATVCMTRTDHCSGTDRIAEVCEKLDWPDDSIIVNLQGDEPLIDPKLLTLVASNLQQHPDASISTLCTPISTTEELFDPNIVKVVMDHESNALYFSRAVMPWNRDEFATHSINNIPVDMVKDGMGHFRHIGMYCYRADFLNAYSKMESCELEKTEALEQLRALWYGHKIQVSIIEEPPGHGVDTEQDLQRVAEMIKARQK